MVPSLLGPMDGQSSSSDIDRDEYEVDINDNGNDNDKRSSLRMRIGLQLKRAELTECNNNGNSNGNGNGNGNSNVNGIVSCSSSSSNLHASETIPEEEESSTSRSKSPEKESTGMGMGMGGTGGGGGASPSQSQDHDLSSGASLASASSGVSAASSTSSVHMDAEETAIAIKTGEAQNASSSPASVVSNSNNKSNSQKNSNSRNNVSFESQNSYHTAEENSDEERIKLAAISGSGTGSSSSTSSGSDVDVDMDVDSDSSGDLSYDPPSPQGASLGSPSPNGNDNEQTNPKEKGQNSASIEQQNPQSIQQQQSSSSSEDGHFLNKPLSRVSKTIANTKAKLKISPRNKKSAAEDKEILLNNMDTSPMDITPIENMDSPDIDLPDIDIPDWGSPDTSSVELLVSPSESSLVDLCTTSGGGAGGNRKTLMNMNMNNLTTPPRISPFHSYPNDQGDGNGNGNNGNDDEEDETTPRRKTNQPPSPSVVSSPLGNIDLGNFLTEVETPSSASTTTPKTTTTAEGSAIEGLTVPIDEKHSSSSNINLKPRRRRVGSSGKGAPGHRRTRSGDGAAATLLTGSSEWIGMELDNLPLPNQRDVDVDEDEISKDEDIKNKNGIHRRRGKRKSKEGAAWNAIRNAISADEEDLIGKAYNPLPMEESISTRFSPRIAGESGESTIEGKEASLALGGGGTGDAPSSSFKPLQRSHSFGDYSVSTAESHFSWISNRTSLNYAGDRSSVFSSDFLSGTERSLASGIGIDASGAAVAAAASEHGHGHGLSMMKTPPSGNLPHRNNHSHSPFGIMNEPKQQHPNDLTKNEIGNHFRPVGVGVGVGNHLHHQAGLEILQKQSMLESERPRLNKDCPTFKCPGCNTVQREFFTVSSAPKEFEGPAGYLVSYFVLYMILSLFIFGVEEGWPPLDCIYFAINTLTTTGFGDYVPTADAAKIICAIFIYFGVAVIGLLLGSLHANLLDDTAKKAEKENLISNCPICCRDQIVTARSPKPKNTGTRTTTATRTKQNLRKRRLAAKASTEISSFQNNTTPPTFLAQRDTADIESGFGSFNNGNGNVQQPSLQTITESNLSSNLSSKSNYAAWFESNRSPGSMFSLGSSPGSDAPVEVMHRQSHTRHYSLDSPGMKNVFDPGYSTTNRKHSEGTPRNRIATDEFSSSTGTMRADNMRARNNDMYVVEQEISDIDDGDSHDSSLDWSTGSHESSDDGDIFRPVSRIKAAKYVFLTLKQAVANSLFVITVGSVGFYYLEQLSAVDAFYFTTVLLTTVGFGDIVPVTSEGKMFCAIYGLIAGGVLLHNISMISMIPLELRKRRIERAVLIQFGDELDDAALEELVTGPLVQRLQLSENNPDGSGQCTREMFALAMLVRLGRITEQDVRSTFAAFSRLDKDDDGLLTSKEIVMSAVERKKRQQIISPRHDENLLPKRGGSPGPEMLDGDPNKMHEDLSERGPLLPNAHIPNAHKLTGRSAQNYMSTTNNTSDVARMQRIKQRERPRRHYSVESEYSALTYEEFGVVDATRQYNQKHAQPPTSINNRPHWPDANNRIDVTENLR
uniref:Potassium channel domain-containing protein n=1 Tax=Chaetoceros debilis TaxID=122233 RepID=A0A7S3VAR4_9STRA